MKTYNKPLLALLISAMTVMGAAGLAEARMPGGHGGPHHGGPMQSELTPEMRQLMEKAYERIAPLQLELRAKQQELTAKIYGGADDKSIQQVMEEVSALQKRLTEARVKMQQDFARAGIPLHRGGCGFGGSMGMGQGPFHGPRHGFDGMYGPCPGAMTGPGPVGGPPMGGRPGE